MSIFKSMEISSSGLSVERMRLDTVSSNIANASTTKTEDGEVYRKKTVTFKEKFKNQVDEMGKSSVVSSGVEINKIEESTDEYKIVYEPTHPDADENGFVTYPNVDLLQEMVDMMSATRAYEANVTAFNASKSMLLKALEIGR
ncbi:flagellar basal body rod protein FlgC [Clostridium grantii]|uniref:Flagellar basal-body rod protein FlgC n=1 Tax=Clostridium grantii DSM 8605 TaxID=1121316 RepID=A0A1M5W7V7_9CLOT|nr:flagellar basal body rod protein FlgC [Clostridium grantii]SHH83541.1 flagellar basal-body rod protein FlgC [Clostridium grantii DSM 8605]